MKPNGFMIFRVDNRQLHAKDGTVYETVEKAEAEIRIPKDLMSEIAYVVLPVYTNKKPK